MPPNIWEYRVAIVEGTYGAVMSALYGSAHLERALAADNPMDHDQQLTAADGPAPICLQRRGIRDDFIDLIARAPRGDYRSPRFP